MLMLDVRDAVLNLARALLFMREINGANRSELIDEMIRRTGLDPTKRLPWCAAFVAWVGYAVLRKQWPLKKVAGCVSLYDDAKAKGMIRTEPAPGAIFLLYSKKKKRFHHTGFVVGPVMPAVDGVGTIKWATIEGNTDDDGGAEGTGCFERQRAWAPEDRFIYYWE
jgi:hypothetical protein